MKKTATALATIFALSAGAAQAADLRMSWWGGDSRHIATQEALKACGEKHGHTIQPEFTGWTGHQEKVTTQLAGGTEADIMQINWPWLPLLSLDGSGFADLREHADTIDLGQWPEEQLESGTMNGKLNGLPISTTGRVFFFNRASFEKAGVALPATWDDLISAASVFKEKLGEDYFPFDATGQNGLTAVLIVSLATTQMTGKDLIDPATNTVAWTAEELQEGIEFHQSLVDQGVIRAWKTVAGGGNVELFELPAWSDGRIAGSYEWDSTYSKFNDPLEEGQELVPVKLLTVQDAVTEGVYRKPSMVFSISKNSKNPEAAAQIVNCLLNEPEGIQALGDSRGIPASRIASETLADSGAINPQLLAANRIVMEAKGPTVSPFNEHPEVREIFQDTLEAHAYGQISAADAAVEIIEGVNGVLEKF